MYKIGKPRSTKGLAVLCARLADSKLAKDIIILNLEKLENAASDFFVVCSCDSTTQVEAIVDSIYRQCTEFGLSKPRAEGIGVNEWVLLDFFDVVVHIMLKNTRNFYKLEKLWADGQFLQLNSNGEPKSVKFDKVKDLLKENILD